MRHGAGLHARPGGAWLKKPFAAECHKGFDHLSMTRADAFLIRTFRYMATPRLGKLPPAQISNASCPSTVRVQAHRPLHLIRFTRIGCIWLAITTTTDIPRAERSHRSRPRKSRRGKHRQGRSPSLGIRRRTTPSACRTSHHPR